MAVLNSGRRPAIGTRETQLAAAQTVKRLGTKEHETVFTVVVPIDDPPEGVTIKTCT